MSTSGDAGKVSLRNAIDATRRLDELGTARWIEAAAEVIHKAQTGGQPIGKLVPEALVMRDGNVVLELPANGSTAYTAPERLRGGTGDRRSDVWSLGVMLWEALAHVRLFEGTSDEALRRAVETDEITPVNEMNANVPSELGAICTKALQRDPAGRYQSAKVMAAEISAVLDDAGYPEGNDAIAKWISKELGAKPAVAAAPVSAPIAAAPVPVGTASAPSGKLHNQTMMGMQPFADVKPPVLPAPKTSEVIPLVNPIIPLETKKGPEPGNVTKGWDIVPEPKPEVKPELPRPKTDSKGSLPSWATRPGGTQPPPSATPAQPIVPAVPFSPNVTLQGISNPGIKPPEGLKLPDAPPGATVTADKPPAFNQTSIVGSSISSAVPTAKPAPAAFDGNRTATMGSNAIIEAVNATVSAANPPSAPSANAAIPPIVTPPVAAPIVAAPIVPAAPVLPKLPAAAAPIPSVVVAPVKISEAETVNTPAVTLPPPAQPPADIRKVNWDDAAAKPAVSTSQAATAVDKPITPNTAVAKLPPPSDDDFTDKGSGHGPDDGPSSAGSKSSATHKALRGDRTSKGDLLAGWGVSTAEHEALRDDDDAYEADQAKAKKRLFMIVGGAVGALALVVVIALAMSGGKKEEEPAPKSTAPIGDPVQAGGGVSSADPPKQEPPKEEPKPEPVVTPDAAEATKPEPPKEEPAVAKVDPVPEPKKPDPIVKPEPKKPDPVIVKKPEPKKPDPVAIKKPEPKKPDPVIVKKPEPKKPDPVAIKKPEPAKADAATAYKTGFQLYVKGDTNGALASFKEALASNPGYAPTWRGIGLVYEKLGRKSQAATAFKRYLELSPGAGDAEQIRNRLEKLGS